MIESQANTKIRKIPINQKLTATFEHDKKVSRGEYIFSENGKADQDVETGWAESQRFFLHRTEIQIP
jgi:hypothetical protein